MDNIITKRNFLMELSPPKWNSGDEEIKYGRHRRPFNSFGYSDQEKSLFKAHSVVISKARGETLFINATNNDIVTASRLGNFTSLDCLSTSLYMKPLCKNPEQEFNTLEDFLPNKKYETIYLFETLGLHVEDSTSMANFFQTLLEILTTNGKIISVMPKPLRPSTKQYCTFPLKREEETIKLRNVPLEDIVQIQLHALTTVWTLPQLLGERVNHNKFCTIFTLQHSSIIPAYDNLLASVEEVYEDYAVRQMKRLALWSELPEIDYQLEKLKSNERLALWHKSNTVLPSSCFSESELPLDTEGKDVLSTSPSPLPQSRRNGLPGLSREEKNILEPSTYPPFIQDFMQDASSSPLVVPISILPNSFHEQPCVIEQLSIDTAKSIKKKIQYRLADVYTITSEMCKAENATEDEIDEVTSNIKGLNYGFQVPNQCDNFTPASSSPITTTLAPLPLLDQRCPSSNYQGNSFHLPSTQPELPVDDLNLSELSSSSSHLGTSGPPLHLDTNPSILLIPASKVDLNIAPLPLLLQQTLELKEPPDVKVRAKIKRNNASAACTITHHKDQLPHEDPMLLLFGDVFCQVVPDPHVWYSMQPTLQLANFSPTVPSFYKLARSTLPECFIITVLSIFTHSQQYLFLHALAQRVVTLLLYNYCSIIFRSTSTTGRNYPSTILVP